MLVERFHGLMEDVKKRIEEDIAANILSKQRFTETSVTKLQAQIVGIEEVRRKLDKTNIEHETTFE